MNTAELRTITESVVGPLEHGLLDEVKVTEFLGTDLQLRFSLCGLATAALQTYLRDCHDVRTTRIIIDLPETSPSLQSRHVFLRHNAATTIDPTYSQFFEYAGFSAIDVSLEPAYALHYPETKIAVIQDPEVDGFIASFAAQAWRAARAAHGEPERSVAEIEQLSRAIWKPEKARRFPAQPDPMVDRIVARMKSAD